MHYHVRNQTCTIVFASSDGYQPIWQNGREYLLALSFRGEVNDKLRGLYRSSYVDAVDGSSHTIATTQFEPTDARRAFPCFDEPALKATFCLTVRAPVGMQVLSNTPPASVLTEANRAYKLVKFQPTPRTIGCPENFDAPPTFESYRRVSKRRSRRMYRGRSQRRQPPNSFFLFS